MVAQREHSVQIRPIIGKSKATKAAVRKEIILAFGVLQRRVLYVITRLTLTAPARVLVLVPAVSVFMRAVGVVGVRARHTVGFTQRAAAVATARLAIPMMPTPAPVLVRAQ